MSKSLKLLILLGFIWGFLFSLAKWVMTNHVHPLSYALWQAAGPLFLLLPFVAKNFHIKAILTSWRFFLFTGIFGVVIPNVNMYFCAPHLAAGTLGIIVNMTPLIVYPLAILARQEVFKGLRLFGVMIGIAGLLLVLLPSFSFQTFSLSPWLFLAFLTPLSLALCTVFIAKFFPKNCNPITLTIGMLSVAALVLAVLVTATHHVYLLTFPLTPIDWIILASIILTATAYIILFELIKRAGPVFYSFTSCVVVLTSLFWGRLIFNEKITSWTFLGLILIIYAISLVNRTQNKESID